jgi:hypothetical protein
VARFRDDVGDHCGITPRTSDHYADENKRLPLPSRACVACGCAGKSVEMHAEVVLVDEQPMIKVYFEESDQFMFISVQHIQRLRALMDE